MSSTTQSAYSSREYELTHDIRDDLVRYQLAVLVPVLTILLPTSLIVPHLPMQEKDNKECEVKVGDGGVESGG
jgi:hypothetical protein